MQARTRLYRAVGWMLLGLLIPAVAFAGDDCSADVAATLARENVEDAITDLQFEVEISAGESCARIVYDLVVEEQLPNGHANQIRISREVKLDDGSLEERVGHRLDPGHRMLEYEARLHSCRPCDLMP